MVLHNTSTLSSSIQDSFPGIVLETVNSKKGSREDNINDIAIFDIEQYQELQHRQPSLEARGSMSE